MRPFSILLIFLLNVQCAFAQVRNKARLKVVEMVEIEHYYYPKLSASEVSDEGKLSSITRITFGYNTSNELISMHYWHDRANNTDYELNPLVEKKFTLANGKLTRIDYENGRALKDFTFNYVLDANIITKRQVYNHDTFGGNGCLRFDTDYLYFLSEDGYPQLVRSIEMWFTRLAGTKYFQKGDSDDSSFQMRYMYEDGDMTKATTLTHNGTLDRPFSKDYHYCDKVNDTNISWTEFPMDGREPNDLEMLTEWINVRSKHLLERYGNYGAYDFVYIYDNKGNIKNIEQYRGDRLMKRYTVTYKLR